MQKGGFFSVHCEIRLSNGIAQTICHSLWLVVKKIAMYIGANVVYYSEYIADVSRETCRSA